MLSERFASSSSYQYHHHSGLRRRLGETFLAELCRLPSAALPECDALLDELTQADYVDVDFDVIGHAVTLTAYWSPSHGSAKLVSRNARPIKRTRQNDRIEVGVLHPEVSKESEQISMGGFLTVIGDNDHPG